MTRIDGSVAAGKLLETAPAIKLHVGDKDLAFDWAEVLSVRPTETPAEPPPPAAGALRFNLADGSSFAGTITAATERSFVVEIVFRRSCTLETPLLRSIVATAPPAGAQRKLNEALADLSATSDVAVVAKGDDAVVLHGAVQSIRPEHVVFMWNDKAVNLPWARVAGVVFARTTPRGASCLVSLRNEDMLAGRISAGDDKALTLQSSVFENLELPWPSIARIDCRSERVVLLSEMKPLRHDADGFFDKQWPYVIDRTFSGRPIELGGRTFARGLTMHSRAALVYGLGGQFEQFAAIVGILDEMQGRGCAAVRIIGDERVLWEARHVRGGQPPREVAVSVRGVDELMLIVDFDEELDLSDQVAWGNARLIRR